MEMKMKKLLVGALVALCTVSAYAAYKDGTYQASALGHDRDITIEAKIAGGKIAALKIVRHGDTQEKVDMAVEELFPAIIGKNGVKGVDAVSGASDSSNAILSAVEEILKKASQ